MPMQIDCIWLDSSCRLVSVFMRTLILFPLCLGRSCLQVLCVSSHLCCQSCNNKRSFQLVIGLKHLWGTPVVEMLWTGSEVVYLFLCRFSRTDLDLTETSWLNEVQMRKKNPTSSRRTFWIDLVSCSAHNSYGLLVEMLLYLTIDD